MRRRLLPLMIFAVLVGFLGMGLTLDPRAVPSPLIGKPAPDFSLPRLGAPDQVFSPDSLRGQVWMLNVWASWCVACRQEHPVLIDLAQSGAVPVYGLNYKDGPRQAIEWLQESGNPYLSSFSDPEGLVGIDFGVYGVPETFIIDQAGVIRYKHAGPLTSELLRDTILPMVRELGA